MQKTSRYFYRTTSFIFHPRVTTPVISILIALYYRSFNALALTIIFAIIGWIIDQNNEHLETSNLNDLKFLFKRIALLILGLIYFFMLSIIITELASWTNKFLIILFCFLLLTFLLRYKFSAHIYFNFGNIMYFNTNLISILSFFSVITLLIGLSRVKLGKHSFAQIFFTYLICLVLGFIWRL